MKRSNTTAVNCKQQIFILGGFNSEDSWLQSIEVYYVQQDLWNVCQEISLRRPLQSVGACIFEENNEQWIVCFGGYNDEEGKVDDGEIFSIGSSVCSKGNFQLCSRLSCYGSMYQVEDKIMGWCCTGKFKVIAIECATLENRIIQF